MGVLFGALVGGWVGSCQITKNQINLYLIEIFQFCLKICGHPPYGWVVGWMGWLMGGVMSNH